MRAHRSRCVGYAHRPRRLIGVALLMCLLPTTVSARNPTVPTEWSDFFTASLDAPPASLDRLAARAPTLDLPLATRAIDRMENRRGGVVDQAYESFARWHFWMGKRWDLQHTGLWGVSPLWTPQSRGRLTHASATLTSLQLVQLEALANMAARRDLVFDALVWWSDRRQLQSRLARYLYDPFLGAYCDLDSSGNRTAVQGVSSLIPLAFGAPRLSSRSLQFGRNYWLSTSDSTATGDRILQRVREIRSGVPELPYFTPARVAALAIAATDALFDRNLSRELRDTFALLGEVVADTLSVAESISPLALSLEDLGPRAESEVTRARVAVAFLRRSGLVAEESFPELESELDSLSASRGELGRGVLDRLTDALVQWKQDRIGDQAASLLRQRAGETAVDGPGSSFHFREADASHWAGAALDLLAEVLIDHELRAEPSSRIRLSFEPEICGSGDATSLRLRLPRASRPALPDSSQLLWTDGLRLYSPVPLRWEADDEGFRARVREAPSREGIWQAVVTGLPARARSAPSLAVVKSVDARVVALPPQRDHHVHRLRLRSQVRYPIRGAVEVEAPMLWSVEPAARITYALSAGEVRLLDLRLIPDPDASPGHYPLKWSFYDGRRLLHTSVTQAVLPYQWLTVGLLATSEDVPPAGVLPLDLTRTFRGVDGAIRWHRLPLSSFGPQGQFHFDEPSPGVRYLLTAFTTGSPAGRVVVNSDTRTTVYVNGSTVCSAEEGASEQATFPLLQGVNQVLVRVDVPSAGLSTASVRLESLDATPLRGVDDNLELLLDGFAYVQTGGSTPVESTNAFARDTLRFVPLSYDNPAANSVSVVGTFNGWAPDRAPMARDEDGKWVVGIRVPPGRFEYKFAVDGHRWIPDPANPNSTPDGFGGRNSVLNVQ